MTEPAKLNHQYACVVDRDTISLAALISSYQFVLGTHLPLFPSAFHTKIPTLKHRGWGTLATQHRNEVQQWYAFFAWRRQEKTKTSASATRLNSRTFQYDSLSRLTSASNPESGTTSYTYDANGNVITRTAPAPNQAGSATVTTTYTYDALNRLTQKSYSDGTTPMAGFVYDRDTGWGAQNLIGRLLYYSNATTATVSSYDAMGRVTFQYQCVPPNCNSAFRTDYSYNYLGGATSYTNGMGVTFTQSFDSAGRVSGLTSSLVDSQHPATLFTADSSVGYYPHGALRKMTYGNGLTGTTAFNNAFQPCRISLNSSATALSTCTDAVPSGNLLDFAYGFNAGSANNGNVASWSAAGQQAFNRTYSYDSLNRLAAMSDSNTSQQCRGLSWTYDAWGNRTDQTQTAGTCNSFHQSVNTKNQLVDTINNTLQYDAVGHRVTKTVSGAWRDYLYDTSGNVVAETTSGGWNVGYAYLGGQLLAQYSNSTTYFAHRDHLGSTRLLTALNQS